MVIGMFLVALIVIVSAAKNFPSSDFVPVSIPQEGSAEMRALNWTNDEFAVAVQNGTLAISDYHEKDECEFVIPGGKLVGKDYGEWGGKLIFVPADSTKESTVIKTGNIKFIFSFHDTIYFLEGLAHLSMSSGALYKLERKNAIFTTTQIISFDDAPFAYAIKNDSILIASYQNFYIVHNYKWELFIKDAFWGSLYPNSIAALDSRHVYIGMRGGYSELNLTTKNLLFYKYKG